MLRTTWEKTTNPYIRFFTAGNRPPVAIFRKISLPRPQGSDYEQVTFPLWETRFAR